MKLIFAQGNPEPDYAMSRHNVGFQVLNAVASKHGAKWTNKPKFHAITTEVIIGDEKVMLVKPTSYYNETGTSARKLIDFYKVNPETELLIIHDDLSLPFGTVRVRKQGGDAGNNGIKSINTYIDKSYTRIKIGIFNQHRQQIDDADFVLAKFTSEESEQLAKTIIPHSVKLVEQFCNDELELTSYKNIE